MPRLDPGAEKFYNLRLPNTLNDWTTTFEKSERSQILRAFISVMISMGRTARGRSLVRKWANGQTPLRIEPPVYLKGIPVPPHIPNMEDTPHE